MKNDSVFDVLKKEQVTYDSFSPWFFVKKKKPYLNLEQFTALNILLPVMPSLIPIPTGKDKCWSIV